MLTLVAALLLSAPEAGLVLPEADANQAIVLVAERGTPAYDFAEQTAASSDAVHAERKLWRGLNRAAELLNGGIGEVTVMVAEGAYTGQFDRGVWVVPEIDNPSGTLAIQGGYNETYAGRQPFGLPVHLTTAWGRDGAILQFEGRSTLRHLVVSGLTLDAAPSNSYDARTNSIVKAESRSYPLLTFGRLTTERLTVVDNVFLNGAHGAVRLDVTPASESAVVEVHNNFFLNNLIAFETQTYPARLRAFARLDLRHNSFVLSWPFNPDPASSNVSAVELYHSDAFAEVAIERNLFAYNPGGAMQHDWREDRMPDLTIRDNLFYLNGVLWGESDPEAAVIAGKFGTDPIYRLLDIESVEDDLSADVGGNVAFDPEIPVVLSPLQTVDGSSVEAQPTVINSVRRLFGANTDGGTVAISGFAPQMSYDVRLVPLPRNEAAQAYGVQPTRLYGMGE